MTTIEQIKAEIERLYDELEKADCMYKDEYIAGARKTLGLVSSFLSDLESEKPINQEGLEEEIEKITVDAPPGYEELNNKIKSWGQNIARHFAKWGAEHARK